MSSTMSWHWNSGKYLSSERRMWKACKARGSTMLYWITSCWNHFRIWLFSYDVWQLAKGSCKLKEHRCPEGKNVAPRTEGNFYGSFCARWYTQIRLGKLIIMSDICSVQHASNKDVCINSEPLLMFWLRRKKLKFFQHIKRLNIY